MDRYFYRQKNVPDFVALLFVISLLVIDFLPYFKTMEIINVQFFYITILNLLIGLYLFLNTYRIDPCAIISIKNSYSFRFYVAFLFLCSISIFTGKNLSLVFTKITEIAIVFCLFINLSILFKNKLHLWSKIILIVGVAAFLQSAQQLMDILIVPRGSSILNVLGAMKGNTGNINILAASLSIKIPFLLLGITYFTDFKRVFLLLALFTATTIIFLTGARTSLINIILIYIVYIIYLIKEYHFNKQTGVKIVYLIIPILVAFLYSNSILQKTQNTGRYKSIENRFTQINTDDESSQARLFYWKNAIEISKKYPFLGIGLGNYQVESIPYEKNHGDGSIVSLHAHNDFLEIMAETGIFNSLIYLSIFILVTFINIKRIFKSKDSTVKTVAILCLLLNIVYGLDSLFNFPMYRPTMQIFFALLLALTIINDSSLFNSDSKPVLKGTKVIICSIVFVSLITSYSAYLICKASNLEYLIKTDDVNTNVNVNSFYLSGDEVVKRIPSYPNVFNTSESFYEYAAIYYLREKNYDKAMNCFSKASKINPYSGRIDFYKYMIALNKGNLDSAYIYCKKAFYLKPVNLFFYKTSTILASTKKDTGEIKKEHKLFFSITKKPVAWTLALSALQNGGAERKQLVKFIDQGLKIFPKDSILLKSKNSILITDYLVKGQEFESKAQFENALQSYKKALEIDTKNVYALQNIGFYYYNRGKNKEAIPYLLNAIKYPDLQDGKTEYFLGFCYRNVGDESNFCKYLNSAKAKKFAQALQTTANCN
ncbi:O-antigen ligase family protein [Flavobacterium ustbae]|uniref:O-antigen ligase family protein n=1 Tax=Flavobacterium ustbae TaxID=2488790 RepID=UPI000F76DAD6|nr:O-antigen ligase family protein [Flavobacterium ustbae]